MHNGRQRLLQQIAYAIPNQEATTVAKVLIDNWVSRFGVPMELHSNQERNFESNLFQRVTEVLVRWYGRTVQSYYGRTLFEGCGRTSERLGSTRSTVPTGRTPRRKFSEVNFTCLVPSSSEEPKKVIEYEMPE